MTTQNIIWISANTWIAWQMELFIRRFDRSSPSPSACAMGLSKADREMGRIVERIGFVPSRFIASLVKRGLVKFTAHVELTNWRIHKQKMGRKSA